MSVRSTSAEAYHSLEESGVLSAGRWEVYQDVFHNGPTTSGEFFARLATKSAIPSQKRARFTELREMGLFKECGVRKCNVTGFSAIEWDVTERVSPLARPKRKSLKSQLKVANERIAELEELLATAVADAPLACPGCASTGKLKRTPPEVIERLMNPTDKLKIIRCSDCGVALTKESTREAS